MNMVTIDGDRMLTQVDIRNMHSISISVVILLVDYALLRLEKVKSEVRQLPMRLLLGQQRTTGPRTILTKKRAYIGRVCDDCNSHQAPRLGERHLKHLFVCVKQFVVFILNGIEVVVESWTQHERHRKPMDDTRKDRK